KRQAVGSSPAGWGEARKAVGAPLLAADTVVDEEEPVRIVFRLDGPKLWIIPPPELLPPRGIEEIALIEIRARVRRNLAQLGRGHADPTGFLSRLGHVHWRPYEAGIGRRPVAVGNYGEREGIEQRGMGGGSTHVREHFGRCPSHPLVDV